MTTVVIITCYLILAGLLATFVLYALGKWLDLLDRFWAIAYRWLLDLVAIYAAVQSAQMDVQQRRASLPPPPRRAGRYDVEIEVIR